MKCIALHGSGEIKIFRTTNINAERLVGNDLAVYVTRESWKLANRKFDKGCEKQALESFRAMKKNMEKGAK